MGLCLSQSRKATLAETQEKKTAFDWNTTVSKEPILERGRISQDLLRDLYAEDRKRQLEEYDHYVKILECR